MPITDSILAPLLDSMENHKDQVAIDDGQLEITYHELNHLSTNIANTILQTLAAKIKKPHIVILYHKKNAYQKELS